MGPHALRNKLVSGALVAAFTLSACGGASSKHAGTTTTTDATAYVTAYTVCLQLNNTDVARSADPQTITDDEADAVFAGLALQLKPASRRDPKAWAKLQGLADKLRKQLAGTAATDDQIESTIGKMIDACTVARRRPSTLSPAPTGSSSSTSSSSSTPSSAP